MDYHKKYLKYKLKYINMKNTIKYGGNMQHKNIFNPTLPNKEINNEITSEIQDKIINPTLPLKEIKNDFTSEKSDLQT